MKKLTAVADRDNLYDLLRARGHVSNHRQCIGCDHFEIGNGGVTTQIWRNKQKNGRVYLVIKGGQFGVSIVHDLLKDPKMGFPKESWEMYEARGTPPFGPVGLAIRIRVS